MTKKVNIKGYDPQEIPEVEFLNEVEENGLYAVKGYQNAVSVEHVTPFGKSRLSEEYEDDIQFLSVLMGENITPRKPVLHFSPRESCHWKL